MRTLILVRHAKSSWDNPALSDKERPLNHRGKSDAPKMGKLLKKRGFHADMIVSSPAKRAYSTAKRIAKELGYSKNKIEKDNGLYMADTEDFYSAIQNVPGSVYNLVIFSHNYGITNFANFISGSEIDNIPTCGLVRIDFNIETWKQVTETKGELIYFEYPKKYPDGV